MDDMRPLVERCNRHGQIEAELELLRMHAKAEEDVALGRVAPAEEAFAGIRRRLLARKDGLSNHEGGGNSGI